MTEEQQTQNKCLQADSPAVQVLKTIVIDKNLLRDLKQMERFEHTGMPCLQNHVFHSSSTVFSHIYLVKNNVSIGPLSTLHLNPLHK